MPEPDHEHDYADRYETERKLNEIDIDINTLTRDLKILRADLRDLETAATLNSDFLDSLNSDIVDLEEEVDEISDTLWP